MGQRQAREREPDCSADSPSDRPELEETLTCRQRAYLLLEEPESSRGARAISYTVLVLIFSSVFCFILQTEPGLKESPVLKVIEIGSLTIFTVEYVLRFAVCNAFDHQTRCEFVKGPANVVDLLAIFPTYLLNMFSLGNPEATKPLRVFRALRLVRIFRILRLRKYSEGMEVMLQSMVNSARPLLILMYFLSIGIVFFGSLLYHAEAEYCPDLAALAASAKRSYWADCASSSTGFASDGHLCCDEYGSPDDYESIVAAFWWSMVTMTTVGYGDKVPKTVLGRAVGFVAMIAGIVLISLHVAIVGSKFLQAYEVMEESELAEHALNDEEEPSKQLEAQPLGGDSSPLRPGQETARFLEKAHMRGATVMFKEGAGEVLKPMSDPLMKTLPSTSSSRTSQSQGVDGKLQPKGPSPWQDHPLRDTAELREHLRTLERGRKLSRAAQDQVELLLEMLDHLQDVDMRLSGMREKDAALDSCLHNDFVALSNVWSGQEKDPDNA